MAKYRYACHDCGTTVDKYASLMQIVCCQTCSAPMTRLLPNIGSKKVTETVDPFLNVRQEEDHHSSIKDRSIEHFWEVEVPRLIQTYSTETCLQEGWLVYNEKGDLVIGKPVKKAK